MNISLPHRRTALIVEDNYLMLDLLEEVLSGAGFDTTTADHGQAAIDALGQQRFDVLVVDIELPNMSGMTIGDRARDLYQNQIVIIVITGGASILSRKLVSLKVFADDFVMKPFDNQELIVRIESKLRRMDVE